MKKEQFKIIGMTCSACAARVEKAVSGLSGANDVSVNLLKNSLSLTLDDTLDSDAVINAVRQAGYDAVSVNSANKKQETSDVDTPKNEYTEMKKRLLLSVIFTLPLFYISMGHMMNLPLPSFMLGAENAFVFAFTQFLLLIPIVFINFNYYKNGFKSLFRGSPNMDSLIAIGSSAAVVYGIYAIYKIAFGFANADMNTVHSFMMDLYFESAGMILTLITLGKTLEARAKRRTSDAITKLMNLAPKTARVERDGEEQIISADDLKVGDIIILKAGETASADGVVIEGFASFDESALTGESIPVDKKQGDTVIGATVSLSGYIKFRAEKVGDDTALSGIIRLVDEATASKAPIAKLADKVSAVFVPTVISIAIISVIVWLVAGYGVEFALSVGISVLVISCPCALGLATPTAIMVSMGKGATNGILIKSAEALQITKEVNTVVLDKTGTVTEGKPRVTDVRSLTDEKELLSVAAALEKASEHPIAAAIVAETEKRGIAGSELSDFSQVEGGGIKGSIDSLLCLAGNRRLMERNGIVCDSLNVYAENLSKEGKTPVFIAKNNELLGVIAVADTLKETSKNAVKELVRMGIEVVMLTGDNEKTAQSIAGQLGSIKVIAEVLPDDKEREIRRLKENGKKVMMVGDGINDAPAIASADVGVAIGAGTDIAIESADIVLMKNDLQDVSKAIRLSRATIRNIKQNLFWAFIYNIIGIPIAAGVFYLPFALRLNPMIAALCMSFSSVFVVSNALRLKTVRLKNKQIKGETKMKKVIVIEGMACIHCANRVKDALIRMNGVESAEINLEDKTATVVLTEELPDEEFKTVIEKSGYNFIKIS